ncbi:MAG: cell division protein FtsZ [Chlorobiaceae bacterium]
MAFIVDPEQFDNIQDRGISIKIVGVGGCGCNALNHMIDRSIEGVEYIAFDTDPETLVLSKAQKRVRVGKRGSNGFGQVPLSRGALSNPLLGEDDANNIGAQLKGADIVIIAAGMGKGTGSTVAPVIALIARNMGILTVGIVTEPFNCERRMNARGVESGVEELRRHIDTLILVNNESIMNGAVSNTTVNEAFILANDLLYRTAKGIADIITSRGHINVNFADLCELLTGAGDAVIGTSVAAGERRALQAATNAVETLRLEGISVKEAKGILVNITGELSMRDLSEAMTYIEEQVGSDTTIINGYIDDREHSGETRVTVLVTGCHRKPDVKQEVEEPAVTYQKSDLGVPAYLRKDIKISEPVEKWTTNPVPGRAPYEERISKGKPDTPAYMRKINN